jgi:hypothetical protein
MVRLAYENIEENGTYTFEYTEGEDPKANLGDSIDLLADYNNKYNRRRTYGIPQDDGRRRSGVSPEDVVER